MHKNPFILCLVILSVLTFSRQHVDDTRPTTQNDQLNRWIQDADWYYSSKIDTAKVDTIRAKLIINPFEDSTIVVSATDIAIVDSILLVADFLRSSIVGIHLEKPDSAFIVRARGEGYNEIMYPSSITQCNGMLSISSRGLTTMSSLEPPFSEIRRSAYSYLNFTAKHVCFEEALVMNCNETNNPDGAVCVYDIVNGGDLVLNKQFLPNIIPFPMQPGVYNTSNLYADEDSFYYAYRFIPIVLIVNSERLFSDSSPISGVLHLDHPGFTSDLSKIPPIPNSRPSDMTMPPGPQIQFVFSYEDFLFVTINNRLYVFEVIDTTFVFKQINVFVNSEQMPLYIGRMDIYKDTAIFSSGRRGEIYSVDLDQIIGPAGE